jgi:hypothetical protein
MANCNDGRFVAESRGGDSPQRRGWGKDGMVAPGLDEGYLP